MRYKYVQYNAVKICTVQCGMDMYSTMRYKYVQYNAVWICTVHCGINMDITMGV